MEEEYPEISGRIAHHVEAYGWLRSQGADAEAMTGKDLVDRLQVIVLRWKTSDIDQLAQSPADPEPAEALGSIGILVRAEGVAMPFLGKIAGTLGCTSQQVLFSSPDEIVAALSSETPLTTDEIDRRLSDGFVVERTEGALDVSVDPNPPSRPAPVLSGMTGCRGRAVGPVKVIRDARDLDRLEIGDVLVTAASTTDMMGGVTVFPTRGGGPPAVARAIAVVADEGGLLSHAAIVCRERGIPCVLGTERATATLSDGQVVEVDATRPNGTVLRYEAL
jgi:phosphohistidine swiveling domain-containing protein